MNQIVLEILDWYKINARNLPWRNTKNPYKIWLSEIILQQTQIKQGLSYYLNITEYFPDVHLLAAAKEETILKLWQGLGYYSRARNLHKTAKIISENYNGQFPQNYSELLKLPGIGEYTAAAIASFAFNLQHPVIDGNVFRFISRLYNIQLPVDVQKNRKYFLKVLDELMEDTPPALFNNAIMEIGSMVCKPIGPLCSECPVSAHCLALKAKTVDHLPVKIKTVKIKTRYLNFLHFDMDDGFFLEKRTENDIWHNLFQLPLIESNQKSDNIFLKNQLKKIIKLSDDFTIVHRNNVRHVLTHQILITDFWYIKLNEKPQFTNKNIFYTKIKNHKKYPVPKLIDNYLLLL